MANCANCAPGLQLLLDGSVSSVVLPGLQALTQYSVQVYSVLNQISSEPLAGTETTCELPSPDPASSSSQAPPPHSPSPPSPQWPCRQ